jgi:succinoglycan biosynthesis transport protein ExoP
MAQIESELDVAALGRALWRKAWLIILLVAAATGLTYYGLGRVQPIYTADSSILIGERESPLTRPRDQAPVTATDVDESAIQSQVEVIRSREIADTVIDKLDLTHNPDFDPPSKPSLLNKIAAELHLDSPPAFEETPRQRVMDVYFERLSVFPVSKSRVIGLSFGAPKPVLAADVTNAIAEAFVDLQQQGKRESAVAATEWLQQEIERLRGKVAEAEGAVADYRAKNGLFNLDQNGTLSTQQLSDLNAELARARAARSEAESRAKLVQSLLSSGGALDASQEVLNSALIQRLRERQVALRAQIADLSTTLLPTHPQIRALNGQLRDLNTQIKQEVQKVLASLQTAAQIAAAREQSLTESLSRAKTDASQANEKEIQLRALEREAAAQRDLLESFLSRYREAAARTDANYLPGDARIISRAVPPLRPSFPKKVMMSVAAGLAAFLLAIVLLLLREFTSGRAFRFIDYDAGPVVALRTVSPIEPSPGHPVVSNVAAPSRLVVPLVEDDVSPGHLAPVAAPTASASAAGPLDEIEPLPAEDGAIEEELYQPAEMSASGSEPAVNTDRPGTVELAEILASPSMRLALFAGAEGGEGSGEIAFAAARRAAQQELRFVLIDLGARPSEVLGGSARPGLGDLLAGDAAFGDVIRRDDHSHVHVIPTGAGQKNPPRQRLRIVIGALSHTYDKVIVVADSLADWPSEHITPDLAAIVCGPETTEDRRQELYEAVLENGARSALIVRYTSDPDGHDVLTSAAA